MRRRVLFGVGLLLLAVLAVPAAAVYFAAFTESGLRFIAERVPEQVGRARISVGQVSGTLAGGIRIERLEIDHERVRLLFEGVEGRMALAPLLWQTIDARELTMRSAYVEVRPRRRPPQPYTPRFLPRALIVQADRLLVENAVLVVPSGRRFEASDLQASGTARHRIIRFFEAGLTYGALRFVGHGELRAAAPMQLTAAARLIWRSPGQPQWVVGATAEGDLDELILAGQFAEPLRADFTGRALDLTSGWHWEGDARIHDFDLQAFGGGGALGRITGRLEVRGDAGGFEARGPLTPEGLGVGPFATLFRGSYGARILTADSIEIEHGSGARLSGSGRIAIVPDGPWLDLRGTWRSFRWPLAGGEAALRSASGRYQLAGRRPFELRASGSLEVADLPPMEIDLDGRLATDRLVAKRAEVAALDGRGTLSGELRWSPERTWSVAGTVSGMNPAALRADLPGRIGMTFEASGQGFGSEADFALRFRDLTGRLRDTAASGAGRLARSGDTWQFDGVQLALGGARLSLDGRIDERLDLRFGLDARDLGVLAADSRGELRARGTIRGTLRDPAVDVEASGGHIVHGGVRLEGFTADVDFDARRTGRSVGAVQLRGLEVGGRRIDRLDLTLDGSAADHVVKVNATAPDLSLAVQAWGAFAGGIWTGKLRRLDVTGSRSLRLALQSAAALRLSADAVRVEPVCLHGSPARLCLESDWNRERWSAAVTANDLPMSTLTAGLTPGVEYGGTINVAARLHGSGGGPLLGEARVDLTDAQLEHRRASGRIETITLGSGSIVANAGPSEIDGEVKLDAGPVGTIDGTFSVRRTSERWQDMPLEGTLRAHTAELDFLSLYVPQVDRAAGTLAADLELAGTLGVPLIDGTIRLSDAELDFYQINLALRSVGFEARLAENGLEFRGSAQIGPGTAQASGRLEWRDALPSGRFRLAGSNLRVVDLPEARIDASPELDFRIERRRIAVTGTVKIPFASIEPADLTNAVRTSSDEIVVGEDTEDPASRFQVVTAVDLALGDRVSIDTYGLTGRLTGQIAVRSGYEEITSATGELSIEEGRYTAYGRRLDVERGRLIFSGGPVANPGIDIRAVKQFPDVKAGVNVRGTLRQPRMSFFSEPPLPQQQIVSLILAGGSLASVQNNESNAAGNELLAQGGAILAQQLGARIGLEDVSIESNLANETSLVLGKYLSPRLYVSYGISLTEAFNTVKLRYTLDDRWTIRTEAGEERSADLVYTIEK